MIKKIVLIGLVFLLFQNPKQAFHFWKGIVSSCFITETGETLPVSHDTVFASPVQQTDLLKYAALYKGNDYNTFFDSLFQVAKRLAFQPEWLLKVMLHESRLDPAAQNSIGAVGLIQIKPETAVSLGTTSANLVSMSGTEQLRYIEKFYRPVAGKITSYHDLRLYNLFPLALHKADAFVLQSPELPASVVATRNPVFDTNGDQIITVGEFKSVVRHE